MLGGLHGIPVLIKDTIGTKDKLNTSAGSFALLGSVVARDAGVVAKLRQGGAIILGKASLSEWAAFRSLNAPNGFSPRGGQGKNPYVLSADPCGSSSGSAISVAANLIAVSIGTETDGSILCPSHANSAVGIKPTVGLTSRGQGGATVFDKLEISNIETISNATRSGEAVALLAEFKVSVNAYLKQLVVSPVRTLADVIAFNQKFSDSEMNDELGQEIFLAAEGTNGIGSLEKAAMANLEQLTKDGFQKLMWDHELDALVTHGPGISAVLAIGGFPGINVPAGYDEKGVPFGINFGGLKGTEQKLIQIAYGFEQLTKIRKPPTFIA
ncbi:unnamed protein product [Linum tenue]|uniref:Amidase domain-containing protein n=1 Tax=Linum tenue TaxID=586396 RepID=A0AAV0MF51_9ROSI|nr:unnamed protein product [Linum tenue]